MDALGTLTSTERSETTRPLLGSVVVAIVWLLCAGAAILAWRRLAGGLTLPLDLAVLSAVGLLLVVLLVGARLLWALTTTSTSDTANLAVPTVLSVCGGTTLCAISLPGTSPVGLLVAWGLYLLEELWAWRAFLARPVASDEVADSTTTSATLPRATLESAIVSHPELMADPLQPPGAEVLHQITRSRTAEGGEMLTGWVRVHLAPGQRSTTVHLAFCPPFAGRPRARLVRIDGPEARIKPVQVLPFGARFDLKLPRAAVEPAELLLQLAVEADAF